MRFLEFGRMAEVLRTALKVAAILLCLALAAGVLVLAGLMVEQWRLGH